MTDAVKRYEGTEKRIKERMAAGHSKARTEQDQKPSREEMAEVKERIWVAVKAGKITQEQAEERWEG